MMNVLEQLQNNIKAKFSYLPQLLNSMSVRHQNNCLIIDSQLKCDMFNIICCTGDSSQQELNSVIDYFKQQQRPAAWWVGFDEDSSHLEAVLTSYGFQPEEAELAMAASLDRIPDSKSTDLIIKQVTTAGDLKSFTDVIGQLVEGNEAPEIAAYFHAGSHVLLHKSSRLLLFVGFLDGLPISTSTVFLAEGVAGIFDIIALPEARGKGVGTAMTLAAMRAGKAHGYKTATLTATNDAKFLYEKIGFKALREMCVYPLSF